MKPEAADRNRLSPLLPVVVSKRSPGRHVKTGTETGHGSYFRRHALPRRAGHLVRLHRLVVLAPPTADGPAQTIETAAA